MTYHERATAAADVIRLLNDAPPPPRADAAHAIDGSGISIDSCELEPQGRQPAPPAGPQPHPTFAHLPAPAVMQRSTKRTER
jgi:hypothetical protein